MIAPEYSPERGIIRLPRHHLEAMVGGDERALDPHNEIGRGLKELGVVVDGGVDGALRQVLHTLRHPRSRFGLRLEQGADVALHRGWIAASGVVVVSGGTGADDVQDLRAQARPSAAARVLAGLMEIGPAAEVTDLPERSLPWDEVMVPVREGAGTGWARDAIGPTQPVRLTHLRWSSDGVRRATTAMVLLSAGSAGIVEARAADDGYELVARTPAQVWTGLCTLTR